MQAGTNNELTPKQAEFARLYALEGCNQSDAYRRGYDVQRAKPETIWNEASKLIRKPQVAARIKELLDQANMESILSQGAHLKGMIERRDIAAAKGNDTAASSWDKTIAQCLRMTAERVFVGAEKSETDDELITRLSGGDAHKATMLRAIIGKDSFA